MNTLISKLTDTNSLAVNIPVAIALTFIAVSVLALIGNLIINPSTIANASFGGFNL